MARLRMRLAHGPVVAALILCLAAGCGDGHDDYHDDYHHHDDFHDVNLAPACEVISVIVDRDARELVAEIAVTDDGEDGSTGVDLTFVVLGGGAARIVDVLDATSGIDRLGNRLIGVAFDEDFPGPVTDVWLSTITPDPLYSDGHAVLEVEVSDDEWITECSFPFAMFLPSEPVCIMQAPVTGAETGGIVPVRIEIGDLEGDPAELTLWYSLDGGVTLLPATIAGASDGIPGAVVPCDSALPAGDGVIDIPTALGGALVTVTVDWDSELDGVGIGAAELVDLFAFVQDCVDRPADSAPPCLQRGVIIRNP